MSIKIHLYLHDSLGTENSFFLISDVSMERGNCCCTLYALADNLKYGGNFANVYVKVFIPCGVFEYRLVYTTFSTPLRHRCNGRYVHIGRLALGNSMVFTFACTYFSVSSTSFLS